MKTKQLLWILVLGIALAPAAFAAEESQSRTDMTGVSCQHDMQDKVLPSDRENSRSSSSSAGSALASGVSSSGNSGS